MWEAVKGAGIFFKNISLFWPSSRFARCPSSPSRSPPRKQAALPNTQREVQAEGRELASKRRRSEHKILKERLRASRREIQRRKREHNYVGAFRRYLSNTPSLRVTQHSISKFNSNRGGAVLALFYANRRVQRAALSISKFERAEAGGPTARSLVETLYTHTPGPVTSN